MAASIPQLILDINGSGPILARVEFNDIHLAQDHFMTPLRRTLRINGWSLNGTNRLQVRLVSAPPSSESEPPIFPTVSPPLAARFSVQLRETLPNTADTDRILIDYRWSPTEQPLTDRTPIIALSQDIQLTCAFAWLWTSATPVAQLSTSDQREIAGLLQAIHTALTNRAIADLLRLQSIQVQEQASAIGEDGQKMLQKYAEFLQERMEHADWQVMPIDWENLRPIRMAGGRVYRIDSTQGNPPLLTNAGGSTFAIQPYFSKIRNRWLLIR
ncbi:MAG: hypothetical protein N3D16_11405 [Anaerolineales bacterium]|nr:hypothetical protein [Anaerolineales bacterium]